MKEIEMVLTFSIFNRPVCSYKSHVSIYMVPNWTNIAHKMSNVVRKPAFCICENNDADQLRGNREADQRHCFRFIDNTIPLPPIYVISSL